MLPKKMSAALPKGNIGAPKRDTASVRRRGPRPSKKRQRAPKKSGDYWRQRPAREKNLVTGKQSDGVLNKRRSNVARGKSQRGARTKTAHKKMRRRAAWPR